MTLTLGAVSAPAPSESQLDPRVEGISWYGVHRYAIFLVGAARHAAQVAPLDAPRTDADAGRMRTRIGGALAADLIGTSAFLAAIARALLVAGYASLEGASPRPRMARRGPATPERSRGLLFVPQGFDGVQLGGTIGGIQAEHHAHEDADQERADHAPAGNPRLQVLNGCR